MANVLLTLAEEVGATTENHFAVRFPVDEEDCFEFAAGLNAFGHQVYFVNWQDLEGDRFNRMFHFQESRFLQPLALCDFELVFVYKMEGFYFDMPRFFEMVATFERLIPLVINHPSTIRHNIDKSYLFQLSQNGVNVAQPYTIADAIEHRLQDNLPCVIKPLFGERGEAVFLAKSTGDLSVIEGREHEFIAQEFIPEIREGEKSLAFLGYDFQHAVIKRPNKYNVDEFRCNMSLGGTVDPYEPSQEEIEYSVDLLKIYHSFGCPIHFSRIDFATTESGAKLIEAELLNPSIYANYSKKGPQFGKAIAAYFDGLIRNENDIGSRYSITVDAR